MLEVYFRLQVYEFNDKADMKLMLNRKINKED